MTTSEFQPNWASAPGDTIIDILNERNISKEELATRIQKSAEEVQDLLQGRSAITIAIARQLEQVLGASVEYWMTRDYQYRQNIANSSITEEQWMRDLPIEDMIRFKWISPTSDTTDTVAAFLRYFEVTSIKAWNEKYARVMQQVAFKKSEAYESRPASVAAWLRQGEIEAQYIDCKIWDPEKFIASLPNVRSLTHIKEPKIFIPKLREICAESGVALVIVRTPRGCPASGATKFFQEKKALLMLSFRYLREDSFWFAFFHELGHLLLHSTKDTFLEEEEMPSTIEEEEANEFAEQTIIPAKYKSELPELRNSMRDVIKFATKIGVSPGVVVGQLHHYGIVPYGYFKKLVRSYTWEE